MSRRPDSNRDPQREDVAESEKPSTPEPECVECGWSQLASGGAPEGSASGAGALAGYEIVKGALVVSVGSSTGTVTVLCPSGKKAFGGGSYNSWVDADEPVGPDAKGDYGWKFHATVSGGGAKLSVYVVCDSQLVMHAWPPRN